MPDLDAYAAALLRVVDDVATGCAIFTCQGTLLHESPDLGQARLGNSHIGRAVSEAAVMARVLGAAGRDPMNAAPGDGSANQAIDTPSGRYQLAASLLPAGLFAHEPTVVVTIRFTAGPKAPADLATSFKLTPREVEIAHLIAEGDSNQHIADRLQLSVRTVHHHTERVLRKLGVRARAGVASRIFKG